MNYDPNLTNSGRIVRQEIRLVFGVFEYRREFLVLVRGNQTGLQAIKIAVAKVFEDLSPIDTIELYKDGESLICEDDFGIQEEWLEEMLIESEIVSIEDAGMLSDIL